MNRYAITQSMGEVTDVSAIPEGVSRFTDKEGNDFGFIRNGDSFRVYNYELKTPSVPLTAQEVQGLLSGQDITGLTEQGAQVAETAQNNETAQNTEERRMLSDGKESSEPTEGTEAESREIKSGEEVYAETDSFANRNVTDYKNLSEANKQYVRMTIRQALINGLSEEDTALFAKISARTGTVIVFSEHLDGTALNDGNGYIFINPTAAKKAQFDRVISHEIAHSVFREKGSKKLLRNALKQIKGIQNEEEAKSGVSRYDTTVKAYRDFYADKVAKNIYTQAEVDAIIEDEINSAYAEEILGNKKVWEYILDNEDIKATSIFRVLNKLSRENEDIAELSRSARRYVVQFRKMFNELAERKDNVNFGGYESIDRKNERLSIGIAEENRPVLVVNDDIAKTAKNDSELVSLVKQSITKFPYIAIRKNKIEFNNDTQSEVAYSKYTQWLRRNAPDIYRDKMRLFNHPGEIILATTDYINEAPNHKRKDNIIDFARGKILVDVNGNKYSAEVVIGFTDTGICQLHDVVKMTPTSFNYKKIDAPSIIPHDGGHLQNRASISANIIAQDTAESQEEISENKNSRRMLDKDLHEKSRKVDTEGEKAKFIANYTKTVVRSRQEAKSVIDSIIDRTLTVSADGKQYKVSFTGGINEIYGKAFKWLNSVPVGYRANAANKLADMMIERANLQEVITEDSEAGEAAKAVLRGKMPTSVDFRGRV